MTHARARFRFYLEAALAILATVATVLVLWRPDWIEALLGTDPDKGSGALEWAIAISLAAAMLLLSGAAWRHRPGARISTAR